MIDKQKGVKLLVDLYLHHKVFSLEISYHKPGSGQLREVLAFSFNTKKYADEVLGLMPNTYDKYAFIGRRSREWFHRVNICALKVEDRPSGGRRSFSKIKDGRHHSNKTGSKAERVGYIKKSEIKSIPFKTPFAWSLYDLSWWVCKPTVFRSSIHYKANRAQDAQEIDKKCSWR